MWSLVQTNYEGGIEIYNLEYISKDNSTGKFVELRPYFNKIYEEKIISINMLTSNTICFGKNDGKIKMIKFDKGFDDKLKVFENDFYLFNDSVIKTIMLENSLLLIIGEYNLRIFDSKIIS